jgi:hypothetical protein
VLGSFILKHLKNHQTWFLFLKNSNNRPTLVMNAVGNRNSSQPMRNFIQNTQYFWQGGCRVVGYLLFPPSFHFVPHKNTSEGG